MKTRCRSLSLVLAVLMTLQLLAPISLAMAQEGDDLSLGDGTPNVALDQIRSTSATEGQAIQESDVVVVPSPNEAALDDRELVTDEQPSGAPATDGDSAPTQESEPAYEAQPVQDDSDGTDSVLITQSDSDQTLEVASDGAQSVTATSSTATCGPLTVEGLNDQRGILTYGTDKVSADATVSFTLGLDTTRYDAGRLTIVSSNPSVVSVPDEYAPLAFEQGSWYYDRWTNLKIEGFGASTVTVTYEPAIEYNTEGNEVSVVGRSFAVTFRAVVYPTRVSGCTSTMADASKTRVSWKAVPQASGYYVYQTSYDSQKGEYSALKKVKTLANASTTTFETTIPWEVNYYFVVRPYLTADGKTFSDEVSADTYVGYYLYDESYACCYAPTASSFAPKVATASYDKVAVSWKGVTGVSGYMVYACPLDEYGYPMGSRKLVATARGQGTTSVKVEAQWDTATAYLVCPYLSHGGKTYARYLRAAEVYFDSWSDSKNYTGYTLAKPSVSITSVKKVAAKKLRVSWKAYAGVTKYYLQRSEHESMGYKTIATLKGNVSTHTVKATPGTLYYFRVVAIYGTKGSSTSDSFGQQIPVVAKTKAAGRKSANVKVPGATTKSYGYYSSGVMFSYRQGKRTYVASLKGRTLSIAGFNNKLKCVWRKKIKLSAYKRWGGFYHAPDGNNYIVTGDNNYKESKTKPVIFVTKYSSTWKKGKTAKILGGATSSGIYEPFAFTDMSFGMQDSLLRIDTGSTMFKSSDGLHHQKNLAFTVNTKTMTAKTDLISWCSHCFGQRTRIKDGTLYVAEHGDGFPLAMMLSWKQQYGAKEAPEEQNHYVFKFNDNHGSNYTGADLGDMEVGATNVLVAGSAEPHSYGVRGVKGSGNDGKRYSKNLFLTLTNRKTGKTTVKWLTSYHPRKLTYVSDVSMVKLSEDRYGILYNVNKKSKSTLQYLVIDATGKKILSRTIKGASYHASSRPFFSNGWLMWTCADAKGVARYYRIRAF